MCVFCKLLGVKGFQNETERGRCKFRTGFSTASLSCFAQDDKRPVIAGCSRHYRLDRQSCCGRDARSGHDVIQGRAGRENEKAGQDGARVNRRYLRNGITARNSFLRVNYKDDYSTRFGSSDASFAKFWSAFLAIRTASCSLAVRCRIESLSSFDIPCLMSSALRDSMFERTIS